MAIDGSSAVEMGGRRWPATGRRERRRYQKEGVGLLMMETDPLEIQQSKRLAAPHAPGYEKCAETEENRGGGFGHGLRAAAC